MAKQQTANSGRSPSNRKTNSAPPKAAASKSSSAKTSTSRKSSSRASKSKAPSQTTTNNANKPGKRVTKRPEIVSQPSAVEQMRGHARSVAKTLRTPAFWQSLSHKLPSWTDEVGAILLIVAGVVMLTALLNTTSEAALSITLSRGLRQFFGYGAYFVSLVVLGLGVWILLPKFGIVLRIGWTKIIALEVIFGAFTALLHLFANDPETHALAREGKGGGFLGWALMQIPYMVIGQTLAILLFGAIFAAGLVVLTGLRPYHLTLVMAWISARLQATVSRLDALSFEPEVDHSTYGEHPENIHAITPATSPVEFTHTTVIPEPPKRPRNTRVPAAPETAAQSTPSDATKDEAKVDTPVSEPKPKPKPLSRAEKDALVAETRRNLGAPNGRSLVAPGEPGARPSVVPRDLLSDARVVPAVPRARVRRDKPELQERYFTVDDFRETKKIGKRDSRLPALDMLNEVELNKPTEEEINTNAKIIKNTLLEFDVETEVVDVKVGPTVTQYAVSPYTEQLNDEGEWVLNRVRVSEITRLDGDLALALSAKRLRIQAPVPGHSYVGIEVPNRQPSTVALRPVLESEHFYKYRDRPLALPLGRDVSGEPFIADLSAMPHLLIAGTTGSGKSIMLAAMTTAFIMNNTPDQVKLVLLDPKMVELSRFNGLPHLLGPVETELDRIVGVLRWATREMDRRYKLLEKEAARNLAAYNRGLGKRRKDEHLPFIVIIIDEIGDLMLMRPDETERALTRLAQMARAVGIHLMVATQRPSVDVITGLIKANFPARISFAVASGVDSRVILDSVGAETLMGRGDMLFLAPDAAGPQRVQGCYVSDEEVIDVVNYWRDWYDIEIEEGRLEEIRIGPWERGMTRREVLAETDPMLEEAIALVVAEGEASASLLQRRLGLGYPRAARLMDLLQELGIVGASKAGGRVREVLIKPGGDPFKKIVDKKLKDKK